MQLLPLHARIKLSIARAPIVIAVGIWAMVPDIVQFTNVFHFFNTNIWSRIGLFQGTRIADLGGAIQLVEALHNSKWANVFFFHQTMDVIDKNDSAIVSGVLVLIMAALTSLFLVLEWQERRKLRARQDGSKV
jgi:hypothetical protein